MPHPGSQIVPDRGPRIVFLRAFAAALVVLLGAGTAAADEAGTAPPQTQDDIRGAEVRDRRAGDVARSVADGVLFLPRLAVHGVLYSSGFGIAATQDAHFVARAKDLLLFLDRGGVYPRAAFSSESFPALGGNLFYRGNRFGTVAGGAWSNDEFWIASGHFSWQSVVAGERVLKLTATGRAAREDDRVFHGIGAHPRSDPRSFFLPGATAESGRYLQRREELDLVLGLRATPRLEVFLDGLWRKRRPANPTDGGDKLADAFDVAALPGASTRGQQLYTEISARYDTRPYPGVLTSGLRAQGYAGVSNGTGSDRSRFLRSGADVSTFVPVIRDNRLFVLRGTLDMVENFRDEIPIAFTEYPRHLTFRGASSRTILRTDEWVLVPSLAYQWPLSDNLSSQLFVDGLLVADRPGALSVGGAPWAAGLALEIHTRHHALGRLVVSGGSEGGRIGVDFGSPIDDNDRSEWK